MNNRTQKISMKNKENEELILKAIPDIQKPVKAVPIVAKFKTS